MFQVQRNPLDIAEAALKKAVADKDAAYKSLDAFEECFVVCYPVLALGWFVRVGLPTCLLASVCGLVRAHISAVQERCQRLLANHGAVDRWRQHQEFLASDLYAQDAFLKEEADKAACSHCCGFVWLCVSSAASLSWFSLSPLPL